MSSSSHNRMSSDIWYHFVKMNKKWKCRYCHHVISCSSRSSSNLKRHLKGKHPTVAFERSASRSRSPSTGDETAAEVKEILSTPASCSSTSVENLRPRTDSRPESGSSPLFATPSPPSLLQQSLSRFVNVSRPITLDRSKALDLQLIKMICKEFFPFSIVEDEEFKKFVWMLCPTYHLPSRKTLSNALLSSTFNDLVIKIKNELAIATAVCLTSDAWTSNNNVNFYALTAHFIDENTKLKSYLLECSEFENRHTAQNIANWVTSVANEFGIRFKIVAIVTDNASNMKAAATILKLRHIGCFAHSLNLIVQHAISSSIQSIVNEVKDTVMFFKKSSFAQSKLTEMQINLKTEKLKLKQDVPTRWNSTYEMLQRFIKNKEPIISSVALLGKPLLLTERDWNVIDKTIEVLKVFHEVTTEVSSEQTISLSKVGVLIRLMGRQMEMQKEKNTRPCLQIDFLLDSILKGLSDRFGAISQNKLVLQSTLLDPRFKKQGFTDSITFRECYNDVVSAIKVLGQTTRTQLQQPLPSTSSSSIWQEFDEKINSLQGTYNPESAAIVELDKYLAEEYLPRNHDPLLWWEFRKLVYPNLYKIMIKRLSIPATSVPCKRIFSKAGQICSEKRSRLTSEKLTKILFINHNLDLKSQGHCYCQWYYNHLLAVHSKRSGDESLIPNKGSLHES